DAETRRHGEEFSRKTEDAKIEKVKREDATLPNVSASPRLRISASSKLINWSKVNRILVVRLRSIGDTVLATPSLIALRRFLPEARIDVLLEDWVAPVLEGFDAVDNVISFKKDDLKSRLQTAQKLRRNKYEVAFNLHGGTTATFFVRASGAKHRVGWASYQYNFLYTHRLPSPLEFWQTEHAHSAEQQLALLGFVGVPVSDRPKSRLTVSESALHSIEKKVSAFSVQRSAFALIHPVAAFDTKQWATENFARVAEFLHGKNLSIIAAATKKERGVLEILQQTSRVPIQIFDDLTLPEITALASRAKIFVGNDSGIAHIAAAVETPSVVIFGSSNINHWKPWTNAPHEIVYERLPCQPCAGYFCQEFGEPECIKRVSVESVIDAIEKVL
ncbi:MAG: glycosyltransferase family 9 protein, partial [Pyrinomonadaceae bacterium]|nr:glycosyltransferase family 9 protein [Pyrinomonadaceae bacterium]